MLRRLILDPEQLVVSSFEPAPLVSGDGIETNGSEVYTCKIDHVSCFFKCIYVETLPDTCSTCYGCD